MAQRSLQQPCCVDIANAAPEQQSDAKTNAIKSTALAVARGLRKVLLPMVLNIGSPSFRLGDIGHLTT